MVCRVLAVIINLDKDRVVKNTKKNFGGFEKSLSKKVENLKEFSVRNFIINQTSYFS